MRIKSFLGLVSVWVTLLGVSAPAVADVYDIYVTGAGDVVNGRYWGWYGNGTWQDAAANPNRVYHEYEPGSGNSSNTTLSFDFSSVNLLPNDVISVSLNYNILDIWTSGRDDVGSFSGGGSVLHSNGTGWKAFDVTSSFVALLGNSTTTAGYSFNYTGFSGFTFSSAEGGDPSFLRITTAVPEPETYAMLIAGLGLMGFVARRRKQAGA